MSPNAAIRSWLRFLAVAAVAGAAGLAHGQYKGGSADGYSAAGSGIRRLDGTSVASPAYLSSVSGGDGYDSGGLGNRSLDGSTLPAAIFTASTAGGDGYDRDGLSNLTLETPGIPSVIYLGSVTGGDGYDADGLFNRPLDGIAVLSTLFAGGGGDGYDESSLTEVALDSDLAWQFVFAGGGGDGYDRRGLASRMLDTTVVDPAPYRASLSGADGYDSRGLVTTRLDGIIIAGEIYTASLSGGDGYDRSGGVHFSLNGDAPFAFSYLGGNGDGHDARGLRHSALDPAVLPPVFLFAGSQGDGYDLALAPYVFYLGENGAAGPMTWSVWRNITFSEQERAAGLASDTADPDSDGLPNLLEYVLGSDPHLDDAGVFGPFYRVSDLSDFGLPALPDKHLTAAVRRDPRIFDATLSVEISGDLSLWDTASLIPVGTSHPNVLVLRDPLGIGDAPRRLMRLRATLDP
jgi:hypothetical protein